MLPADNSSKPELERLRSTLHAAPEGTDRADTAERLRRSEAEFRDLYDNAPVGYVELDVEGRITRINRCQLDMLGYSAEEMLGEPVWTFLRDSEAIRVSLLARLRQDEPQLPVVERTYVTKAGEEVPVLIDNVLLRDEGGRVRGIRSVIQEISALKRAEAQLRRSEAEFRDLYDNAPVGYIELDTRGTIQRVNRSALALLGYVPEEMLGRPVWQFAVVEERNASRAALESRFKDLQPFSSAERTLVKADGSSVHVLIENRLLRNSEHEVTGLRSTLQDITLAKEAQEALRQAAIREQRHEAARRMLQVLMHEVYNPLTGILGNLTLLGMESTTPSGRECLKEIDVCARRIQKALRELSKLNLADPSPLTGVTPGDT